jgi:hypothetical protein
LFIAGCESCEPGRVRKLESVSKIIPMRVLTLAKNWVATRSAPAEFRAPHDPLEPCFDLQSCLPDGVAG